jgi:hypothetical protein
MYIAQVNFQYEQTGRGCDVLSTPDPCGWGHIMILKNFDQVWLKMALKVLSDKN